MIKFSRLVASLLLLAASARPAHVHGQAAGELPDVWMVRARTVSDDLVSDAGALAEHDRALLWARLGEVWWEDDRARARESLLKAVEEVEASSSQETPAARSLRLKLARAIMPIVAARDAKLGERLTALLSAKPKGARGESEVGEGEGDAGALLDVALEVVDADPRRAYELGSAALRLGPSHQLNSLLTRLYRRDAALGAALFREGLAAARASRDESLLHTLAAVAFPHRLVFPPSGGPLLPEDARRAALELVAENLLRPSASPEAEAEVCSLAGYAVALLPDFAALLPQHAGAARIVLNRCQQKQRPAVREDAENEAEQKLNTPEGYLQAARDAKSEKLRRMYTARAAYMAGSGGRAEFAIEILDGMDAALRDELGDTWEGWRREFAAAAALQHFKRGDRLAARRTLDSVPPKLKAFALIEFMGALSEAGERAFPSEMLAEARTALDKSDAPEREKQHWWLTLARLHAAHAPSDGPLVFAEAVASINRAARSDTSEPMAGELPPDFPWKAMRLPLQLVEADEAGVTSAVASVEPGERRAQARLGLLKALLEKRRAESAARPSAKTKQ